MEQALLNGIPALLMGIVAWWIQTTTAKNQKHLDDKLEQLTESIEKFRKELSVNTATNTEAHGKIWEAFRINNDNVSSRLSSIEVRLSEKIAGIEATQRACRTCSGRE